MWVYEDKNGFNYFVVKRKGKLCMLSRRVRADYTIAHDVEVVGKDNVNKFIINNELEFICKRPLEELRINDKEVRTKWTKI